MVEEIKKYIEKNFPRFGVNKKREVCRLLYEIAKREQSNFRDIIEIKKNLAFEKVKRQLVEKRFPSLELSDGLKPCLDSLKINKKDAVKIKNVFKIYPKTIFIEERSIKKPLVRRLEKLFPKARYETIKTYSDFISGKKYSTSDYNRRAENLFIINENFDYIQSCPCSAKSIRCGYYNLKLGTGCSFECSYCFLQSYTNSPGIIIPANIESFFGAFKKHKHNMRVGSGQFTDSLVFDDITEFSMQIIDFFKNYPKTIFEFKTKSSNVNLLTKIPAPSNILISWSLNPQNIIDENEFYTASLEERLSAAKACVDAGYKVGFHFDPIIYYKNWEHDYKNLVDKLFSSISKEQIAWISLGCLRMMPKQRQVIESRFPNNKILDEELFLSYDDKIRYSFETRENIYKKMTEWIGRYSSKIHIYLCMETKYLYNSCRLVSKKF